MVSTTNPIINTNRKLMRYVRFRSRDAPLTSFGWFIAIHAPLQLDDQQYSTIMRHTFLKVCYPWCSTYCPWFIVVVAAGSDAKATRCRCSSTTACGRTRSRVRPRGVGNLFELLKWRPPLRFRLVIQPGPGTFRLRRHGAITTLHLSPKVHTPKTTPRGSPGRVRLRQAAL
ncbi:hypothetical protein BD779DRAFT_1180203 [Infundibulicybe gibba]|nr:hypothetical protein BD779DRAFT_1180203 [Infundibulicybe gibba]